MDLKSPGVGHLAWWFNQGFRYSHHTQFFPLLSSPCAPSPLILCVGSICRQGLPSLWQDGHHGSRHHIFQVEWRLMPIFVFVPSFLQTHPLSLVPAGSRDREMRSSDWFTTCSSPSCTGTELWGRLALQRKNEGCCSFFWKQGKKGWGRWIVTPQMSPIIALLFSLGHRLPPVEPKLLVFSSDDLLMITAEQKIVKA